MPTLHWILETAEDRLLEATDREATSKPAPRQFLVDCPCCDRVFVGSSPEQADRDLGRHIGRDHPLERPVLLIGGRVLGPDATISAPPAPEAVVLANARLIEASVDGGRAVAVDPVTLQRLLSEAPRRILRLRLVNERSLDDTTAVVEFRIRVDVPDEQELEAIDAAFLRHLAHENVDHDAILRFANETEGKANSYRDGLVSYVVAVFAKDDRTGVSDPSRLERALEHFGRAVHYLDPFSTRRVAAAVAACARLNLNEFDPLNASSGVSAVDVVARFLRDLARGSKTVPWPQRPLPAEASVRCPVDETTYDILELVFSLGESPSSEFVADRLARAEHGKVNSYDRAKLAVILGEWTATHGDRAAVARCSKVIANDPVFAAVADRWGVA